MKPIFRLTDSNSGTELDITLEAYDEEENYNMRFRYRVTVGGATFTVHSHLYYSVFNKLMESDRDDLDNDCDFKDYWSILVIPKPKSDALKLIRAAISFVYYLDPEATNCQEVSDYFENRELTNQFDFE